jgi:hypothetical protein
VRRTRPKEGLGTITRDSKEGGSGKMARVGGREGIGIITMDNFVWGYVNVGRSSAKE